MPDPATISRTPPRLVLASASPARLQTLRSAGLNPEVVVSGVNENLVREDAPGPLTLRLAQLKTIAVAARVTSPSLVVGCDSVLSLGDEVLGKPTGSEDVVRRWQAMRGRAGVLHTGHCVMDTRQGLWLARTAATQVRFADVTDEEIEAYVRSGEPLGVAGAFTLDGRGGAFVSGVTGDPHNVVGVSLPLLRLMVGELGYAWTALWGS